MTKSKILNRMLGVAALAMMFGTVSVHAQTSSSGAPDAHTKDAAGKTEENRAGRMSPTGENETTSAGATSGTSGASGSGGTSGASSTSGDSSATSGSASSGSGSGATSGPSDGPDAHTKGADGKTRENRAGRMSPTGENETTSAGAKSNKKKDKSAKSSATSGSSGSSAGASDGPDAHTKKADGKTRENRAGRMSPTGENETTSAGANSGK